MACGLVPIVPTGGASDDFVDATCGYLLPATEVPTEHEWPLVGQAMELSISKDDLRQTLRLAFEGREESKRLGACASERVLKEFTWDNAVSLMQARILALVQSALPGAPNTSNDRPRLAACLRFSNAERELPDCLARLAPFVDEIIAFDEGATDRSAAVAREYHAKVIQQNGGRLKTSDYVQSDWMFSVAPEDRLDPIELQQARALIEAQPESVDSINFRVEKSVLKRNRGRCVRIQRTAK
jgi:hypothetical protein